MGDLLGENQMRRALQWPPYILCTSGYVPTLGTIYLQLDQVGIKVQRYESIAFCTGFTSVTTVPIVP